MASRSWCFTINNYACDDLEKIKAVVPQVRFVIVGDEIGESGTPHYQGYVYFHQVCRFSKLKKLFPTAHIEAAKGTPKQNEQYCSKQKVAFVYGELPEPGKRTDLDQVRDIIKDGGNMRDIVEVAKSYQSVKMAEVILKYKEQERSWKPEVRWYWGRTGSGKTRSAREWLDKDIYTSLNDGKWFEGYDGHENVLIDDFRKDFAKFHILLKILDRYPYRVEVKGGSRQFLAKKIAITCPYPPDIVYNTREDVNQLLRRIDQIIPVGFPDCPDILE